MVWNKGPCETRSFTFTQHETQPIQKISPVEIIEENLSSIDPPHDDMVQRSWCVYAGFSRHVVYVLNTCFYVNRISEKRPQSHPRRKRRPTRPTRGSKEKRLDGKVKRGRVKAMRGRVDDRKGDHRVRSRPLFLLRLPMMNRLSDRQMGGRQMPAAVVPKSMQKCSLRRTGCGGFRIRRGSGLRPRTLEPRICSF